MKAFVPKRTVKESLEQAMPRAIFSQNQCESRCNIEELRMRGFEEVKN
jgi:hypothetical protein